MVQSVQPTNGDLMSSPFLERQKNTIISGAGGKGNAPAPRKPITEEDSLNSTQYAYLVDLISEGEIKGLVDGHQSIFFNNTQLQNSDGTYNFQDVKVYQRNGTQTQSWIPLGSGTIEDEKPVNTEILKNFPIVRSITDSEVDAVRIMIAIPLLQLIDNETGDTKGTSVQLKIFVQYDGGGFTESVGDTISGRTSDEYRKQYLVQLPQRASGATVDIKVLRVTDDSTNQLLNNKTIWISYTEIIYSKPRYPNSALIAFRVNAQQFNSIPQRSYLVKGIKVQIPKGVEVDQETGRIIYPLNFVWNGTLGPAVWTSCPAWILWDVLTESRYGFGDHIKAANLDKWAFFAASKYSNQLVPDGFGGQEARFSCNANIQTSEDAYKTVNDLLSVMRCQGFWSAGALTIVQDRPSDPAYLFTLANVSEEGFAYSNSSLKTRPNVAVVSYLDIETRDIAYEVEEDPELIDKYGVIKTEISAFGCTSRGQARRLGRWLIYTERYEKNVVTFQSGLEAGQKVRPGQIIKISDPLYSGSRRAGRIAASTTTQVTVDTTIGTDLGGAPASSLVSVILPDGVLESRQVESILDGVITVSQPFSTAPNVNSLWALENEIVETTLWRVLGIKEDDRAQYSITAVAYNPAKYDYIEADIPLAPRQGFQLNALPGAPQNVRGTEIDIDRNGTIVKKLTFFWTAPIGIGQFRVKYRANDDIFTTVDVQGFVFDVENPRPGKHHIQVFSVSASSGLSRAARGEYTLGPYVDEGYAVPGYGTT